MIRSTLTDLFHKAASVLLPLSQHLLQCIASADVVWADETPLRMLDVKKTKRGYLWTFLTQNEAGQWLISVNCYPTSGCGDAPPTRPLRPSSPVPEQLAPRGARRARSWSVFNPSGTSLAGRLRPARSPSSPAR